MAQITLNLTIPNNAIPVLKEILAQAMHIPVAYVTTATMEEYVKRKFRQLYYSHMREQATVAVDTDPILVEFDNV